MEIQINISVRNPEWYWSDDDYKKEWIAINSEKVAKYSPAISFLINADVQRYSKGELEKYTFKISNKDQSVNPFKEVLVDQLDVTEFIYADGSTPVIVSKSILHNVMAAQNQGKGKFYWYYFIKEDADYVQLESNIWLSRAHFNCLSK
ncbi:hypothetical protein [Pedobacter gandavensis]|uniref:hypothetical protein n=1 Tax=Pedobacter gandavensis TaxID=2679963 RepID=UPI0029300C02|nr:hypothetical protein [Pedobacter gandavensis]